MIVGVISDTHGLMREEALRALRGAEAILHAGDVGKPEVLEALEAIAPVRAVRGNNDTAGWARRIPLRVDLVLAGMRVVMVHEMAHVAELDADVRVVVTGHSHQPVVEKRDEILFLNPGSAGPRRFSLPITVARLSLGRGRASARIVDVAP